MNCKQANENIGMREVLESFSLFPSKEHPKTAYYFAINRQERTPSLLVNYVKNIAFDFGTGKQYDVVSIVQELKQCTVSDALEYLKQFDFSFQKQKQDLSNLKEETKSYQILEVKEIVHPALLEYLKERNLETQKSELQEIHYEMNGKNYFGLGFKNDSGGYEVRNKYLKIALGKKDITTIKNNSETLKIFEGFSDYLSFLILKNKDQNFSSETSDFVILNSVSMAFKIEKSLENYQKIELYLDNDEAGDLLVEKLNKLHFDVQDQRKYYKIFKDLNEYLASKKAEEQIHIEEKRTYKMRR